jgi:hypothetical protein
MRTFTDLASAGQNELYVTMTFSARNAESDGDYTSKFIVLKFPSGSDRNTALSGLRSLVNEVQFKMNSTPAQSAANTPLGKQQSFTPQSSASTGRDKDEDASALRANYEMLIVQLFILSNDLNAREDELMEMRKREQILQQHLISKEKMYEQDAIVRMQLGKRLEQVLMDKEEIKDQLEQCKVRKSV